jgi:hypothetical protein
MKANLAILSLLWLFSLASGALAMEEKEFTRELLTEILELEKIENTRALGDYKKKKGTTKKKHRKYSRASGKGGKNKYKGGGKKKYKGGGSKNKKYNRKKSNGGHKKKFNWGYKKKVRGGYKNNDW